MELLLCMGCYFCGSVDYQNGTACLGGLCTRLIYCTADRVLVQRHAIIRHVCGCYVFHGLLALWAYLNTESKNVSFSEGGVSRHVYMTVFKTFYNFFGCLFTQHRLLGV